MSKVTKRGSGGRRKIGRMKAKCERYRLLHKREKNKIRKLTKYIKNHVNDLMAVKRLEELKVLIGIA